MKFIFDRYTCRGIDLSYTKLLNMEMSLFERPLSFIQEFYKDSKYVNECKIIFLGDGDAGKTSIIERIVNPCEKFVEGRKFTQGI